MFGSRRKFNTPTVITEMEANGSFGLCAVLICFMVTGCVATMPTKPEEQATYYLKQGRSAYERGDMDVATNFIGTALQRPTGAEKVREAFETDRRFQDIYVQGVVASILAAKNAQDFSRVFDEVGTARAASVIEEKELNELYQLLNDTLVQKNRLGTLDLKLGDDYRRFAVLQTDEQKEYILERTLQKLSLDRNGPQRPRMVSGLIAYLRAAESTPSDKRRVAEVLPSLNIRASELDLVSSVFPEFAAERKRVLTLKAFVEVKNADRLVIDDVLGALKGGVRGVELLSQPGGEQVHIVIERVRHDEKIISERTETVAYGNTDVDFLKAAFLMPKGASYLFEQVTGGAEIEYGYVISAFEKNRKVSENVVRGKVGGEYRKCQNARIQNVFGGVAPANFSANSSMESRCSGPSSISIDDLRRQVHTKIVSGVLEIDSVKNVHLAN